MSPWEKRQAWWKLKMLSESPSSLKEYWSFYICLPIRTRVTLTKHIVVFNGIACYWRITKKPPYTSSIYSHWVCRAKYIPTFWASIIYKCWWRFSQESKNTKDYLQPEYLLMISFGLYSRNATRLPSVRYRFLSDVWISNNQDIHISSLLLLFRVIFQKAHSHCYP